MPTGKQTPWTDAEDAKLRALVQKHGAKKWALISGELRTKASKQCRRRWQNHLSIEKNTAGWSPEEDQLLLAAHKRVGNRWTDIAKLCNGRTDNAVKNRWNTLLRKEQRKQQKAEGGGRQPAKRKRAAAAADADDAGAPPLAVAELVTSPTGDLPVLPPEPPLLLATATDS